MAVYCDYTYYSVTYLGTAIAPADFPRLEMRAQAIIDQLTYGRAAYEMGDGITPPNPDVDQINPIDTQIPTAPDPATQDLIKMAVCAVADEFQRLDRASGNQEIASEHVGNNSVSYVANKTQMLSDDAKFKRAAKLYLGATGLMRQGVRTTRGRGYDGWW